VGRGLVSLFTDLSSEAIFPLLPAFLASMQAPAAFIGVLEGLAELVANVLKYVTGSASDRFPRLKPIVLAGYTVSTAVRPLVAFATAPWHVLLVRVGDRIGKGVRTSPRDALIATVTDRSMQGRAYGFHRAMDHAGAALGTLFASLLLFLLGAGSSWDAADVDKMRTVFLWAAVPGVVALVALALTPEPSHAQAPKIDTRPEPLPPALKRALVALILFTLANATDLFLILKLTALGGSPALAPLLWLVLHVVKASTSTTGGRLADRLGRRTTLSVGWLVYAVTWASIGFAMSVPMLFVLGALYGISHGLVEGAERALVADLASGRGKGKAVGADNLAIGMASLVASAGFGLVWDRWGSTVAFIASASLAVVASAALRLLVPAGAERTA